MLEHAHRAALSFNPSKYLVKRDGREIGVLHAHIEVRRISLHAAYVRWTLHEVDMGVTMDIASELL